MRPHFCNDSFVAMVLGIFVFAISIPQNSVLLSSFIVTTCFGLLLALGFQGFNLVNEARHANKGDHMNN